MTQIDLQSVQTSLNYIREWRKKEDPCQKITEKSHTNYLNWGWKDLKLKQNMNTNQDLFQMIQKKKLTDSKRKTNVIFLTPFWIYFPIIWKQMLKTFVIHWNVEMIFLLNIIGRLPTMDIPFEDPTYTQWLWMNWQDVGKSLHDSTNYSSNVKDAFDQPIFW